MFNFSKRNLIIISVILSLVVLVSLNFILKSFKESQKKKENFNIQTSQIISNENEKIEEIVENQYIQNNDWKISIPKINLVAPILEGTSQENLRRGVGHFTGSGLLQGNICLAAHNRGYKYNYFQEIKNLEAGDIIEYQNNNQTQVYTVVWKGKIKETDFSYLQDTKENQITLITCAENMPEYRLCVQACELKTL